MLVRTLQKQLSAFYETPLEHCVSDFLVTDARLARRLEFRRGGRDNRERLLLLQSEDALDVSLYIDESILAALAERDPYVRLASDNLEAFLIALEGVSHFNYVLWNARHERAFTRLELELQAEVDKFVTAGALLAIQGDREALAGFHAALFERVSFDTMLDNEEETRYRDANRYAAKYCSALSRRFRHGHAEPSFVNELRRFYRMSQAGKIRYIEARAA